MTELTVGERVNAIIFSQRVAIVISLVMAVCMMILCALFLVSYPAIHGEHKYFYADANGQIIEMRAKQRAPMNNAVIKRFVHDAIANIFTFDYVNYEKQVDRNYEYFTDSGFEELVNSLNQRDSLLEQVKDTKAILNAKAEGMPVMARLKRHEAELYDWHLAQPVLFSFNSDNKVKSRRVQVDIYLKKQRKIENPRGYAIASIITRELS